MEIKLLVATSNQGITNALRESLSQTGMIPVLTEAATIDELEKELKANAHHCIITEYTLGVTDIWDMAKLVNSSHLSAHSLPIYLLSDGLQEEVPVLLAKEHGFKPIVLAALGETLKADHETNARVGYTRGPRCHEKPTLLAIEDNEDAAELVRYHLKDSYLVDIAHTGEDALSLWDAKRHDLVLLDYMLPGMQGDEVLEHLMRIDPNQPVIIMTAYDVEDRYKDLLLNGASEYLCKPFEHDQLKERCRAILSRAKLNYQVAYTAAKMEKVGRLIWLLDHYLNSNQPDKAVVTLKALKLMAPYTPPEDDYIEFLDKGSLP